MFTDQNLTHLSRQELLDRTGKLVAAERKITAQLLCYLAEVERRMIYLELGFSSMHSYLTDAHGFSESAAARRLAAMRLSRDVPSVVDSIKSGELSLSTAHQLGGFLRNERKAGKTYSPEQKAELIMQVSGKSARDCERKLMQLSPQSVVRKQVSLMVSATETEVRFTANAEQMEKFEKLRALLAHHGDLTYSELFERMADFMLKRIDPMRTRRRAGVDSKSVDSKSVDSKSVDSKSVDSKSVDSKSGESKSGESKSGESKSGESKSGESKSTRASEQNETDKSTFTSTNESEVKSKAVQHRPHIPAADQQKLWQRAGGQCEFVDTNTGQRCTSRWALQVDHIKPFAQNGAHELSNFRLVCANHNKFFAVKAYGVKKMRQYLNPAPAPHHDQQSQSEQLPQPAQRTEPVQRTELK